MSIISINKVAKHQQKSDGAFKLFKDTIKKLSKANKAIDIDINLAVKAAEKANKEAVELQVIKQKNSRFNSQLEKMMNEDAV